MKKNLFKITALFFIFIFYCSQANALPSAPIPAEQAFIFSATVEQPRKLVAEWLIAPGYYLYQNKIHITVLSPHSARLKSVHWPVSQKISLRTNLTDAPKAYWVYQGKIHIPITLPITNHSADHHQEWQISVSYQGCSAKGFCYAPIKKIVQVTFPFSKEGLRDAALLTIQSPGLEHAETGISQRQAYFMTDSKAVTTWIGSSYPVIVILLCFLGLGILLAFTPCTLPMIPILFSIIVGQKKATAAHRFYLSLSYVLGSSLTYALIGIIMAWLGKSIQAYFQNVWLLMTFSGIFIILALSLLGVFQFRFGGRWQQKINAWQAQQKMGHYGGVFLIGCFSTLVISPCVTAPLIGVLAYITETGNILLGGSALFALGLGMGLPLLIAGSSAGKYLPTAGPWMEWIEKFFALLLLGLAIHLLSRVFPAPLILLCWAFLFMATAVYLCFFMNLSSRVGKYVRYSIGGLLGLYGMILLVDVATEGYAQLFSPLKTAQQSASQEASALHFIPVENMSHLITLLQEAKQQKKPVLLNFYARWCESCHAIEKRFLNDPKIQTELQHFIFLRADVTENNKFDQMLLHHYKVIAPPTFLFFNREGKELIERRIVGDVNDHVFLAHAQAASEEQCESASC